MELSTTMKVVLGGVGILWFPAILVAQGLWNRRKANAAQEQAEKFFRPPYPLPLTPRPSDRPAPQAADPVRVARSRRRKARKAQKAARNERRFGASAEFSR